MDLFAEPRKIAMVLSDFPQPWFFCGGWAIDLFLNRVTRSHQDVDIALLRQDQLTIQTYLTQRGWTLEKAVNGQLAPWPKGEFITLPVHVIWCKHTSFEPGFLELLFNEADSTQFIFRRNPSITRTRERISRQTAAGLSILAPEIVLLYKANNAAAEENTRDFLNAVSSLDADQRAWLHAALAKQDAEHPWLSHLQEVGNRA